MQVYIPYFSYVFPDACDGGKIIYKWLKQSVIGQKISLEQKYFVREKCPKIVLFRLRLDPRLYNCTEQARVGLFNALSTPPAITSLAEAIVPYVGDRNL